MTKNGGERTVGVSAGLFTLAPGLRGDASLLLVLGLLAIGSYLPALWGEFVWDDFLLMKLDAVSSWSGIWQIWFNPSSAYLQGDAVEGHYWPLLYTTFWLEHKLWGFNPLGYHALNLLLHFANTALLWRLLLRMGVSGAWFAAAVFAVHPLHVESVVWIISRKDLLSALFYLGAFFMWIRFTEAPRFRRYAAALALFGAALFCKSIAVTLPAALLIFQWWRNGRVTPVDLVRAAPFFLLGLGVTGFDTWFYKTNAAVPFDYSAYERLLIASRALWFYLEKLLWPTDLAVIYPHWEIDPTDPSGWLYFAGALAVVFALWTLRFRIGRGPMACALFFAVTLSPTLGFVDYSYMGLSFVADRYQYLAGIGVIVFFTAAAVRAAQNIPAASRGAGIAGLLVIALLGLAAWNQSEVYRNEVSLFRHVISLNPDSWVAHQNLGMALVRLGEFEEAEVHTRSSLEIFPLNPKAVRNLGEALKGQERYDESLKWYRAIAALEPGEPLNHLGVGSVLLALGKYPEAVSSLKKALELGPAPLVVPKAHALLGQGYRKMGRDGEADRHFDLGAELGMQMKPPDPTAVFFRAEDLRERKLYEESLKWYRDAVNADPAFALAYAGMGDSLYQLGSNAEAISSMERALELGPRLPIASTLHHLIGQASREMVSPDSARNRERRAGGGGSGDASIVFFRAEDLRERKLYEESLKWYRDAVNADPAFALAYAGMGDSLYQLDRYAEAVLSLERALELGPRLPIVPTLHYMTGEALSELGRHQEAEQHYESALRAWPNFKEALNSLARLLLDQEHYEDALERYRALERIEPENADIHLQIGVALFKAGRVEEALGSFEHALSLNPTLEPALNYREQARRSMMKQSEGVQ